MVASFGGVVIEAVGEDVFPGVVPSRGGESGGRRGRRGVQVEQMHLPMGLVC